MVIKSEPSFFYAYLIDALFFAFVIIVAIYIPITLNRIHKTLSRLEIEIIKILESSEIPPKD